jgi:hypothetical protein
MSVEWSNTIRRLSTFLPIVCLCLIPSIGLCADLNWDPVQTYGMLPLDPEEAAAKGWSVNGLWAGFAMLEAVRSITHLVQEGPITITDSSSIHLRAAAGGFEPRWTYPSMRSYVEASHEAGVLVPATLLGVAGHPLLRNRFPEMERGACKCVDGTRAYWSKEKDDSYFMCVNNPIYQNVLLTIGKEAIDNGADVIIIDEIQGNEFCFYWANQPGFCEHCLRAYRHYLGTTYSSAELREKFGIIDLEHFDFAKRLDGQYAKPWAEADPLFKELWSLQARLNFEARRNLVEQLRAHMRQVGKRIPIGGNTPGAGLGDWNGLRLTAVKWSRMLDFITFENGRDELLPQGKWIAAERIAAAAFKLPPVIIMFYDPLRVMERDFLDGKNNRSVYLYGLLAEAYANGCAFVNYHQKRCLPQAEPLWEDCFRAQRFILSHRDLFEPPQETGASVAVLFVENDGQRYRTGSYVGIAQALAESNIPFDIVIDGDGGYVPVTLTPDALKKYQLVIMPQALYLTPAQKEALESYVAAGGSLLIADAREFGLSADEPEVVRERGRFVILPTVHVEGKGECDLGMAYFLTYADTTRQKIAATVKRYGGSMLDVSVMDRTVCVYPYYQPLKKRVILHMVNSDYDTEANRMRPKKGITIRIKRPHYYESGRAARISSPDFPAHGAESTMTVMPEIKGDFIELRVPTLDVYNIILL